MPRRTPLLLAPLLWLCLACATHLQPAPLTSPTQPQFFAFESSKWVNLHHFLLLEAKAKSPTPQPKLDSEEQQAWQRAVAYYREHLVKKSPLFDAEMWKIRDRLAAQPDNLQLTTTDLDAPLVEVLAAAETVYRRSFWPEHDAANRAMIAHLQTFSPLYPELAAELGKVYRSSWPAEPVRVDVVVYADWAGAYTTIEPTHVTLAASDPRHKGDGALEVLFHEASHGLVHPVSQALRAELERQGVKLERGDLWHALLFYTTGDLVRRHLSADYKPYADAQGLYSGPWARFRIALETSWLPYVDGKVAFEEAVAALVAALAETAPP